MNLNVTKTQIETEMMTEIKNSSVFKNFAFSPLSKISTLIRAIRNALYLFVDINLVSIQKAIHPHTAEEEDLQEHLIRRGMKWKPELPSVIRCRIGSSIQPIQDIEIPQGLVVSTDGAEETRIRFRILDSFILPANVSADINGKFTIEADVECLLTGPVGNVVQDSIVLIDSPPDGIDYITNPNPDPVQTGQFRESISFVRSRIKIHDSISAMWTPDWYVSEAEKFTYVKRAIFKSAKTLGTNGEVKILVQGASGSLTSVQIAEIEDHFLLEENDPGGVAHVSVENLNTTQVDKIVHVKFSSSDKIPSQSILDEISEGYFLSLVEGQDFIDANLKALYLSLPNCIEVEFVPPGNVDVPAGSIAEPASGYAIIGEVYA
ncbi:MAG: baseplate J/gp47 family protein [Leptospiraceae bacterium]|nr:baseplate J/gp47 family protein [Leptospiraceae bacterium]